MSPKRGQSASSVTRKLTALDNKLAKEREKLRSIQTAADSAAAEVQRLDDALADHFAQDEADPEPAELLGERAVAIERAEQPWEARIRGQKRQIAKLESMRETFSVENVGALLAEIEPEARDAAEQVTECARAFGDSYDHYERIGAKVARIVSAQPGMNGRVVPSLANSSASLRRDVKALATGEVPPPLPKLDEEADPTITSAGTVSDLAEGE